MSLRLSLFGAPTIAYGGTSRALEFERRGQLLSYLALKRTWVARSEVAALLWPEQPGRLASANLRKALHRLSSLPWSDRVESDGGALRFDVPTDVVAFESALREKRAAEAVALRRGELLAGFDDHGNEAWSDWLRFERDRLRVAWRTAAQDWLAGAIDAVVAVDLAARLLDDDPLDEDALGLYMTWLARTGQGARAREAYRDFEQRLKQELGLAPSAELRALRDTIGAAPRAVAGAASPAAPDDNFVGRAVELRRLRSLLGETACRLLTITGPGGVGKTRLAQRALADMAPSFADGGRFVALEDVTTAAELGARLAHEFALKASDTDPVDAVAEHLRERQMLMVFDNFEQIGDAAPVVERLLAGCPGLKLIVASRVRLALASEWLLPLDGLPCPEEEDEDWLESFDAARLFVRAARRVAPGLVLAVEAKAIVDICRLVEGLPLALELAAAWTRVLTCSEIAAELAEGTELLHAVDATHPARHASLEQVFEQSWRLLTPVERAALARLAVFRGGFSAEAARAVARAPLPVLAALADKSLLRKDGARLHLHPLVHQFAATRLGEDAERDATQAAHAAHFLGVLTQLRSRLATGDRAALQAIDGDFQNVRRAWTWSIALTSADADAVAASSKALLDFCDHRARFADALALYSAAAASPLARADSAFGALVRSQFAHVLYRLDRYPEAQAQARRALAAARKSDRATRRQALNVLATCALRGGRLAEAREHFQKALDISTGGAHANTLAATLDHLALVEKGLGRYDEALRLGLQALALHRRRGAVAAEALCLSNLGSLHLARREYAAAAGYLKDALAICEREGIVGTLQYVLSNLTEVTLHLGDIAAAEHHARRTLETALATDHRALVGSARFNLARLALRRGDLDTARATLAAGVDTVLAIGIPILKFDALACFAEILQGQGERACARQILAYATRHPAATPGARAELQRLLDEVPAGAEAEGPPPALEIDDLLHRIAADSNRAWAPLLGRLRGAT